MMTIKRDPVEGFQIELQGIRGSFKARSISQLALAIVHYFGMERSGPGHHGGNRTAERNCVLCQAIKRKEFERKAAQKA